MNADSLRMDVLEGRLSRIEDKLDLLVSCQPDGAVSSLQPIQEAPVLPQHGSGAPRRSSAARSAGGRFSMESSAGRHDDRSLQVNDPRAQAQEWAAVLEDQTELQAALAAHRRRALREMTTRRGLRRKARWRHFALAIW